MAEIQIRTSRNRANAALEPAKADDILVPAAERVKKHPGGRPRVRAEKPRRINICISPTIHTKIQELAAERGTTISLLIEKFCSTEQHV